MDNTVIKDILNQYEHERDKNNKLHIERIAEIHKKIPEINSLENKIQDCIIWQNHAILDNPANVKSITEKTDRQVMSYKADILSLLKNNGYPMDYLNPIYTCKECHDTGYTGDIIKERCSCLKQKILQKMYKMSNITDLNEQNFDTFDINIFPAQITEGRKISQKEHMAKVKDACVKYADSFPDTDKLNMLFSGGTGLGKTFLLNCIAKKVIDRGYTVLKLTSYKMFDIMLKNKFNDPYKNKLNKNNALIESDLLIIDDLGTESLSNNITVEYLFNVINERILQKKNILISTNLSFKEILDRYTERVSSRLLDNSTTMLIKFYGMDVRIYKK